MRERARESVREREKERERDESTHRRWETVSSNLNEICQCPITGYVDTGSRDREREIEKERKRRKRERS